MTSKYKILKPLEGDHWNLKVGCHYEIADQIAARLIETGSIEPVIETAMQPKPGQTKRVRENHSADRVPRHTRRDKTPPQSDD